MKNKNNSVRTINTFYDTSNNNIEDSLENTVLNWFNSYSESYLLNLYYKESDYLDWNCFECKAKIKINAKKIIQNKFDYREMFCEKHYPKKYEKSYKRNFIFIKYIHSLYGMLKQKIQNNSKYDNS